MIDAAASTASSVALPLTSDISDLLLREIRQTGSAEALSSAVVSSPLFQVWWIVSCSAEDRMGV
jgi:hypothetical protein